MRRRELLAFERGHADGQALVYAQQVFAGAKLAASLQVKAYLLPMVEQTCEREGCHTLVTKEGDWSCVWIYKHPFVRLLIKEKRAMESEGDPSPLDIWSTGKLFGYSDYEIARYLEECGHIDSAFM